MSTAPLETLPGSVNLQNAGMAAAALPVRKGRERPRPQRWLAFAAIIIICAGFVLPLLWMLSTSLKANQATIAFPPQIIPHPFMASNYAKVIRSDKINFPLYTRNTLLVTVLSVIGTVISSSIVAYGFARIPFKGRGLFFGVLLSTMMIPFPIMMLPQFIIFRYIGDHTPFQMLGTFRPLWLPSWFGSAFSIFLLRQFFMTIPQGLGEAARIDGCNEWGIFYRIILPLSRPALAVVALFTFIASWNNFLGPLLFLQSPQQYTLSLGLQAFQSQQGGSDWNLLMAASVLVMLPVLVLFFLTQKTFVEGIATTGIK